MSARDCFRVCSTAFALALCHASSALAAPAPLPCAALGSLQIPFSTITAAQSIPAGSFQPPTGGAITNLPAFCRVALTMAPSSDSSIRVEVWMPDTTWNGRLQGIGGGGYTGSLNYGALGNALRLGYV